MPRSALAYLFDIIGACDAIESVVTDIDLETYQTTRPARSAVEREFILIGEALASLLRLRPEFSEKISHSRMIVGFRNQLAHEYASINDVVVWGIATNDMSVLRDECRVLVAELEATGESD